MHYCLSKLCYLCLSEQNNLQSIQCTGPASGQFCQKLKSCHFDIQNCKEILICAACQGKVENAYDFMVMCRENCRRLKGYVCALNTDSAALESSLYVGLVDVKNLIIIKEENADDLSVRAVIADQDGGSRDVRPEFITIKEELIENEVDRSDYVKRELSDTCLEADDSDAVNEVYDDCIEPKSENFDLFLEDFSQHSGVVDLANVELGFTAVHIYQTQTRRARFSATVVNYESALLKLDFTTDPSVDKCSLCRKPLTRNTNVKRLLSLTGGRPHICFQCYRHDVNVRDYGRLPYKCSICNKIFEKRSLLMYHHRVHTDEKPYKCVHCARDFKHKSHYVIHVRVHTGERPYACSVCARTFSIKRQLDVHALVHGGGGVKSFPCPLCPKQFKWRPRLVRHMATHCEETPYRCTLCDKMFKTKALYVRHTQVHTAVRPHECSVCEKRFKRKDQVKRHMLSHRRTEK